MKNFINSNLFYYIRTNMHGQYTYVNNHFKQKFEFISDDFIGKLTVDAIHPDDLHKCMEAVNFCLQNTDKKFTIDIRKPQKDGTYFFSTWEFSLYQNPDTQTTEIQCVGFDFTNKQMEIQSILDNLPDLVFIINHNGVILEIFAPPLPMYEYAKAKCLGKSVNEVPCFKNVVFSKILDKIAKKCCIKNMQYSVEMEDKLLWFNANITSFQYVNQNCILWVARDITDLVENLEKIESHGRALTAIARINSHNLRAPVARILGLCNILENDKLSEHNSEIIKYITETTLLLDEEIKKISHLSS